MAPGWDPQDGVKNVTPGIDRVTDRPVKDETTNDVTMPIHAPGSPLGAVLSVVRRVARTDCNVLITGESGTGKEVVVQALHGWSQRRRGPLVPVNCGAIPENLLESELFGHTKGAFTGADRVRVGRFELAHRGTIFLDEVGELPTLLQVKLLRVLQERRIEPLGSTGPKEVDFRLVAATNVALEDAIRNGSFREDLYFRLNVIRVHLPPLRERPMDIPPLVDHFVALYNERLLTEVQGFSEGALRSLMRQPWPGNVRELENVVQGVMVMTGEGYIAERDLEQRLGQREPVRVDLRAVGQGVELPEQGIDLVRFLEETEVRLIDQALARAAGNRTQAAKLLGLNRTTLVEKLKRRGITGE